MAAHVWLNGSQKSHHSLRCSSGEGALTLRVVLTQVARRFGLTVAGTLSIPSTASATVAVAVAFPAVASRFQGSFYLLKRNFANKSK